MCCVGRVSSVYGASSPSQADMVPVRGAAGLNQPIAVYNNWSAYDELSDQVELTEALAMRELGQILRLRKAGVRIDCYVMDAFWYATNGGYRTFRAPHWPNGPERWLEACRTNHVKPGLWLACNVPFRLEVLPEWRSSMDITGSAMCCFEGGFLAQFIDTLQFWYDRGVRLFKFDFANFTIATPDAARRFSKAEIFSKNCDAFREALMIFRRKNPEVLLAAFNGFGGEVEGTFAPVRQTVDPRWLLAFDSIYCGDPRPSDVPEVSFWRSQDIYTDHMVRYYEANGVPLERIDNTGCMVGVTGTCYGRRTAAWKGMVLLEHARGGWMNVYYGNLELLDDAQAKWFARAQGLYLSVQAFGRTYTFGGLPGQGQPYGFCGVTTAGSLYTVVNPSQAIRVIRLPRFHGPQPLLRHGRVQFRDAGLALALSLDEVTLGPEQMAVVGFEEYAKKRYDLGVQEDVVIPENIQPLPGTFHEAGTNAIEATIVAPRDAGVRILMRQSAGGKPIRTSRGAPPQGISLGKVLQLQAWQDGHPVPVEITYDKAVWSGLSWAAGEVRAEQLTPGGPLTLRCLSLETRPAQLAAELFSVRYH